MRLPVRLAGVTFRSVSMALASSLATAALPAAGGLADAAAPHAASAALVYSTASARAVQRQPPAGSCRSRGSGINALPDPRCTPGALNPAVTPASIDTTICRGGWTSTVRPSSSITAREKLASMAAYGDGRRLSGFEYDHLVPLELGGAVNDARNLWPEPDYTNATGFYLNPKDRLERKLNRLVCARQLTLARAQRLIAGDWVGAYKRYM